MINKSIHKIIIGAVMFILLSTNLSLANKPFRVGTTTANFLEIGFGAAGIAMGDAYVSMVNDISSVYWNPAGLAFMNKSEAIFMRQPWLVGSDLSFVAIGLPLEQYGTIGISIIQMGYGDEEVTTLANPSGTGELYDANETSITLSYGRAITDWFSFGAGVKYITSQIWHMEGSALAFDFGVLIKTEFLSYGNKLNNGMRIGMSVSNYGTRLQYDGIDLLNSIDILPNENGNFRDVPGKFRLNSWELPLIFRVGVSAKPIVLDNQSINVSIDALHPNNNSESINLGVEYEFKTPAFGSLFLRGGHKSLFMDYTEYGITFGAGFKMNMFDNKSFGMDYAFRDIGILGSVNVYEVHFSF